MRPPSTVTSDIFFFKKNMAVGQKRIPKKPFGKRKNSQKPVVCRGVLFDPLPYDHLGYLDGTLGPLCALSADIFVVVDDQRKG